MGLAKTLACGQCGGHDGHHYIWCDSLLGEDTADLVRAITFEDIAKTAHEVNRVYCQSIGDQSLSSWEESPDWLKKSVLNGVQFHFTNPNASPRKSHENWLKEKEAEGWCYGPRKDPERKTHPCIMAYHDLPLAQRMKDYLFVAVVKSMLGR